MSQGRKCLKVYGRKFLAAGSVLELTNESKKEKIVRIRIGISMLSEINYCGHVMRLAHFTSIEIVMEKLI